MLVFFSSFFFRCYSFLLFLSSHLFLLCTKCQRLCQTLLHIINGNTSRLVQQPQIHLQTKAKNKINQQNKTPTKECYSWCSWYVSINCSTKKKPSACAKIFVIFFLVFILVDLCMSMLFWVIQQNTKSLRPESMTSCARFIYIFVIRFAIVEIIQTESQAS